MSWHILGAGSLGSLWACRLARAGLPVTLLLRNPERLSAYRALGALQLIEQGQSQSYALLAETLDSHTPIRRLLLACKAYDAASAVAAIKPRLSHDSQLLLLQNGLGSQDQVQALVPDTPCVLVSSTEGAYQPAPFQVVFAGQGQNWLGTAPPSHAPQWLAELQQAAIPHQWCADMPTRLWRKLALNCAINPLTVLKDCRNGGLAEYPAEVAALCQEMTQVLNLCGQAAAAEQLLTQVQQVIAGTAQNYSSMYQDVSHSRRTEIHYLLGHLCRTADQHLCSVPHLKTLYSDLKQHLAQRGLPSH